MASTKQKLIIVESPAKAKTIGRYLGKGYKVEASQGHVCDLPKSQLGVDPDKDFEMKYITIRGRGDILSRIRKEARNASQIYFATDPDREERPSAGICTMSSVLMKTSPAALSSTRSRRKPSRTRSNIPENWIWAASTPSRPAVLSTGWWVIKSARCFGPK